MTDDPTEEELWEQLPDQVGITKVSTLIDLTIRAFARDQEGYALSIAENAVDLAMRETDFHIQARAVSVRGSVFSILEQHEEAARDFTKAAELFCLEGRLSDAVDDHCSAADSLMQIGKYTEAEEALQMALGIAMPENDFEALGLTYYKWSQMDALMGVDAERMLLTLESARMYLRYFNRTALILEIDERRAACLEQLQRFDEAFEVIRNALYIAESVDETKSAYYTFLLGKMKRASEEWEAALTYLDKAEELNKRSKNLEALGSVYREKALCMAGKTCVDEAMTLAQRAEAHFEISGNDDAVSECKQDMARFLREASQ